MHRVRQAKPHDLEALLRLAQLGNFINLPPQRNQLLEHLEVSDRTFKAAAAGDPPEDYNRSKHQIIFVLENEGGEIIGTSGVRCGMGDDEHPNLSFQLVKLVRRSPSLRKVARGDGSVIISGEIEHTYAILFQDTLSPTELGGNVILPEERGGGHGKLLSYCRFHFLRAHPRYFSDRIMAEMMAPLDPYNDGNMFWRRLARRFIHLSYQNADRLSTIRDRREFMYNLLPPTVNLSLLDDDVLAFLGSVGPNTTGAARMLSDIGFRYVHRVDPFDAGAHLEHRLSQLDRLPIEHATLDGPLESAAGPLLDCMVSLESPSVGFRAVRSRAAITDDGRAIRITRDAIDALEVAPGTRLTYSRLDFRPAPGVPHPVPEIDLDMAYEELVGERPDMQGSAAIGPVEFATIIERAIDRIRDQLREMDS